MKVDKEAAYEVVFQHCLDKYDQIVEKTNGSNIFRLRNMLEISGYQMMSFEKVE